ncbi:cyclic-di-GMP phosphodiesterase, flagellum assembly factor TipF [Devosia enhydra]|uniref:Cyclic-di-GMP phosphodiesterase, flagellum assembly factor TipF n=1 Tax=Devosia enhydra TaxID=665118 RepID=A0A1K2I1L2_9HYPH|nr:EAL domain-containing protein [Devosia enhydra]SFZ86151.1 cyclic-di-GMP phosphodiesterase, flagellum assembly factor TipF [Devosia enhydra]
MQGLVYIFIALAALGLGVLAYFGLTFTPIEAFVTALSCGTLFTLILERMLRRRAEARIERGIEELSRLLSTDAQAGSVLSQRVNALVDVDAGQRLEAAEADISVLGNVVRQVAEAVAELEQDRARRASGVTAPVALPPEPARPARVEPIVAPQELRRAIAGGSLVFQSAPVMLLPMRRPFAHDLLARLVQPEGRLLEPHDFMPRLGYEDIHRRIDAMMLDEAVVIARRVRMAGQSTLIGTHVSRATLHDAAAMENLVAVIDANRAIAEMILLRIAEPDFRALPTNRRAALATIARKGATLSLTGATSLRLDFPELSALGVRSVRIDAARFVTAPEQLSDFHAPDIVAFTRRYGIEILATDVVTEQQVLSLFEDGVLLAMGPHLGRPEPVRTDLVTEPLPKAQGTIATRLSAG